MSVSDSWGFTLILLRHFRRRPQRRLLIPPSEERLEQRHRNDARPLPGRWEDPFVGRLHLIHRVERMGMIRLDERYYLRQLFSFDHGHHDLHLASDALPVNGRDAEVRSPQLRDRSEE